MKGRLPYPAMRQIDIRSCCEVAIMKVTAQEIAHRVNGILPILAENAQACVEARSLVPAGMKAMVEAGLFRIRQPSRAGGYELGLGTRAGGVATGSETCPTSASMPWSMSARDF